jgi:hypothetical protein
MEARRKAGRRTVPGGVAALPQAATSVPAPLTAYPQIESIIRHGGQIMIGTVAPIANAAVAHDGKQTLAMLRCRDRETLQDLLRRLEVAIGTAKTTGKRVDEINRPNADQRYEL